ncbi:hypothetical protein [Roseicyclus elongatus]|uniref:hypothetical protein n=1 Tax=Roseicyclus elongatus TaxID=159346 RepID=UPI00046D4CB0|nr:hypothetical protein [Roseibacterium elongatum]
MSEFLPTPPNGRPSLRPMNLAVARMWVASYNRAVERVHERCRANESDGLPLDWRPNGTIVWDSTAPRSCLVFTLPDADVGAGYICPVRRFKPLGKIPIRLGSRYAIEGWPPAQCYGHRPFDLEALGVKWAGWRVPRGRWDGVEPEPLDFQIKEFL